MVIEIIFMANKSHKLVIKPKTWLIVPYHYTAGGDKRRQLISFKKNNGYTDMCHRFFSRTHVINWLFFELYIGTWELSEVGKIYPKGWDYKKASEEQNVEKFNRLVLTGYYGESDTGWRKR